MLRALLRLILVLVILVGAAAFFLGWWGGHRLIPGSGSTATIGTAGHANVEKARDAGAAVGEKTAEAADKAGKLLADGALTAKIKSKMALDDTVRSRSIDVSTTDHVVTLSGNVRSASEHDRAVSLARETSGVTRVIDHLLLVR
jgi:hyperosmotically inducible protein